MSEEKNDNTGLNIHDHVDHQRWLIAHGFINDLHKDNLYMYGAILHKDIQAVELSIDVEKRLVKYKLYCDKSLLNKLDKWEELSTTKSIIGLWRFKRMLKKEGNLNLKHLLARFVKDYCGPKWDVSLQLVDFRDYNDGFEKEKTSSGDESPDKQPH